LNAETLGLYIPIQGLESGLRGENLLLEDPKTGANFIGGSEVLADLFLI